MAIKNYTTQIAVEKTLGEIQQRLARAGATAVLTEYGPDGVVERLSFKLPLERGPVSFLLPAKIDRIHAVIIKAGNVPKRLRTREQAARVAWRIVKDWIEAQLAMIEAEMVDAAEVFLPYAQVTPDGQTLYEHFQAGTRQLALP